VPGLLLFFLSCSFIPSFPSSGRHGWDRFVTCCLPPGAAPLPTLILSHGAILCHFVLTSFAFAALCGWCSLWFCLWFAVVVIRWQRRRRWRSSAGGHFTSHFYHTVHAGVTVGPHYLPNSPVLSQHLTNSTIAAGGGLNNYGGVHYFERRFAVCALQTPLPVPSCSAPSIILPSW